MRRRGFPPIIAITKVLISDETGKFQDCNTQQYGSALLFARKIFDVDCKPLPILLNDPKFELCNLKLFAKNRLCNTV